MKLLLWLCFVAIVPIVGCGATSAPVPGLQRHTAPIQPLSLEELYRSPPAADLSPLESAAAGAGTATDGAARIAQGERLYEVYCAPCHQANGEGHLQRFPALNRNAFVMNQSPQPLIRTVLYGRGVMPAFAQSLSNGEIAAVLSYIRQAWQNVAAPVTAEQVGTVRAAATAPNSSGRR